ncbi:hypothetical protein N7517_010049 [Penicillium concentricum]|uniref:Azaphilone pigments biosynthesis cluster protein L N-terminal domain-containing protein n=1 Tax=Penicillium concentricum TaxID=293559 RepID=A0A9W9RIE6_9EURO|nr:uncharacterized protein N7517_010049 [Penicillium concentricum]KAJ5360858.1 hypothetical protein N7517_010049 [Penicillium concentricum]
MDPVSLTGTAVGIVSLGLTVCQSLVYYYSAFRGYSEDTQNALKKLQNLKDILTVLEDVLQSHDILQTETAATRAAKQNIMACKGGLEQLKRLMDKCKAMPGEQKRDYINRALYPFRRDTIKSLLQHVESLQSNLGTSMDILQLYV